VYPNINVDTSVIGSVSSKSVFFVNAVINTSPDDTSAAAFAPCRLFIGVIQPVASFGSQHYMFIFEDDSIVIGSDCYLVSIIDILDSDFNLN